LANHDSIIDNITGHYADIHLMATFPGWPG